MRTNRTSGAGAHWSHPSSWLGVPPGRRWLDVGCGTGALAQTALRQVAPSQVVGVDSSEGYLAYARRHIKSDVATFQTGDAQHFPFDDASFDVAVSGLVLNFLPRPTHGVQEMVRVVRQGGTVAAYVWD